MIYLFLGVSITLNIVFVLIGLFYLKFKVLGINKLKKDLANKFIGDSDLDDMLDRL